MTVIAHLSDPHLGPLPSFSIFDLMSKRGLGAINYFRRRRKWHDMAVFDQIVADIVEEEPDAVACTGDLTNLALEKEFVPAAVFLGRLGEPERVAAIPGNHDAYVSTAASAPARVWGANMSSDDGRVGFPFVRRHGKVALIGLSSAVPTWPLAATGEVGAIQRDAVGPMLKGLKEEGFFRMLLVHHPLAEDDTPWMRRLRDAALLREIVAREGAELVLHGHNHEPTRREIAGPDGPVPVIGVPSCSAGPLSHEPLAGYNLYDVEGEPGAWRCEVTTRGLTPDGQIEETDRYMLG